MTSATLNRKSFVATIKRITATTAKRSPKPILHKCLVTLNGSAEFFSTDLESETVESIPYVSLRGDDCTFLADPREMLKAANALKCETVDLTFSEAGCEIIGAQSRTGIPSAANWEDFPAAMCNSVSRNWEVVIKDVRELSNAIACTEYAASNQVGRYALEGLLFHFDNGGCGYIVGTDGRRLAFYKVGKRKPRLNKLRYAIIPTDFARAVDLAIRTTDGCDCVRIAFAANHCRFELWRDTTRLSTMTTRLIEGRFPKWQDVVPNANKIARIVAEPLIEPAKRAAAFATFDNMAAAFCFDGKSVRIRAKDNDKGNFDDGADYSDYPDVHDMTMSRADLQAKFMVDFLQAVKSRKINRGLIDVHVHEFRGPREQDDRPPRDRNATLWTCGPLQYVVMQIAND